MKVIILGIRKGTTKGGRSFCNYYFQKPFTDYDVENSDCAGMMTGIEFSYTDYNLKPGDECDFRYEPGFQDKATLSDVVVLKDAVAEQVKAKAGANA